MLWQNQKKFRYSFGKNAIILERVVIVSLKVQFTFYNLIFASLYFFFRLLFTYKENKDKALVLKLSLLFVFDDVDMTVRDTFRVTDEDIQSINKFVKNIASRYAAPEKEKKQIVEDVKKMVEALKESCEFTDTIKNISYLPEAVEKFLFEGYNDIILESSRLFIEGQIDRDWNPPTSVKYLKESWGVKKLKSIPKDLIPYIQIETEAIKDSNDKMILSSYTLGKIEIVEWYIELLTVGSKKYIVPHTKPYLELVRTQLLVCFKKIMNTTINKGDKTIDIKYPKGYEG